MKCSNCNTELDDQAAFCPECGAKIIRGNNNRDMKDDTTNIKNKVNLPVLILVVVIAVGASAAFLWKRKTTQIQDTDISFDLSKSDEPSQDEEEKETAFSDSTDTTNDSFGIASSTIADYGENLNPGEYLTYSGDVSTFKFSYPAYLYNQVEVDGTATKTPYGLNKQTVTFTGTDGSSAIYSLNGRSDGKSLRDYFSEVYRLEGASIQLTDTIISNEDSGLLIVTGYTPDSRQLVVYDLIRVTDDNTMQMKIEFPDTADPDEFKKCGYVVECMYRMCGFSGSTDAPRSYAEYAALN